MWLLRIISFLKDEGSIPQGIESQEVIAIWGDGIYHMITIKHGSSPTLKIRYTIL